jgi:hypothetical protein
MSKPIRQSKKKAVEWLEMLSTGAPILFFTLNRHNSPSR